MVGAACLNSGLRRRNWQHSNHQPNQRQTGTFALLGMPHRAPTLDWQVDPAEHPVLQKKSRREWYVAVYMFV